MSFSNKISIYTKKSFFFLKSIKLLPHRTEPFTWIVKNKITASWWPDSNLIERYKEEGIKVIINCSEFNNRQELSKDFDYYHINIPDYGIPSETQIIRFLEITNKYSANNNPIVVHCVAGCGRTGIMIVLWATYNECIPSNMDAVKWIRNLRPCSLETNEQMELARKLARKYQKGNNLYF